MKQEYVYVVTKIEIEDVVKCMYDHYEKGLTQVTLESVSLDPGDITLYDIPLGQYRLGEMIKVTFEPQTEKVESE